MENTEIHKLIESCIFFSQEKKNFLVRNFCIFPIKKQQRIIEVLKKTQNISASQDDFEVFLYGMRMWKNKKQLEFLESQES